MDTQPIEPRNLRETQLGWGKPATPTDLKEFAITDKDLEDVEVGLETLENKPEEVAAAREAVQARNERKRLETADAIDRSFGEVFMQNLIRLKTERQNVDVPVQTLYLQAAEVAAPAALAEAKRHDPVLSEDLIHDEIMKVYTGTLQRIGALQPDHNLSPEDVTTIHRILKTEQSGIHSGEEPGTPTGPSVEGTQFASSGGKSEAKFAEAEQTKGKDRSEGGPNMFKISDLQ